MPKTRAQKQDILNDLVNSFDRQNGMVFVDYKGLTVKEISQLRKSLKKNDAQLSVAKKTLIQNVLDQKEVPMNAREMEGQIGLVFAYGDTISALKLTQEFGKETQKLRILGGYIEGQVLDEERTKQVADLPPREVMLGQLVGTIAAPMSGFLRVANGNTEGFVRVLNALQETKESK